MVKVSVVQNNYAQWVFTAVDAESGSALWTGTAQVSSDDALAQARYVCETHPEWGPASYFVDGNTDSSASGKMPTPRIDPLKEAEAAGLQIVPGRPPVPRGWREMELTSDGQLRATGPSTAVYSPPPASAPAQTADADAGISERGDAELANDPIFAQRQKANQSHDAVA